MNMSVMFFNYVSFNLLLKLVIIQRRFRLIAIIKNSPAITGIKAVKIVLENFIKTNYHDRDTT
jgi:hypothetical protein